ncbi:MAG TPA: PH domain-containing protein [Thermoleophilia bacterium]|nr:PH domain-containing protein [Thermoleophilia bacterium]
MIEGEQTLWHGHPSWKFMLGFHVKWLLISLIPIAVWVAMHAASFHHFAATWFVVATIVLLAGALGYAWARRATTRYALTDRRIYIKVGLLSRTERSTNLDRIQNVEVAQSLFQRLLGIGSVEWATAGSDGADADFTFTGIEDPAALVRLVHSRADSEHEDAQLPGGGL